jgi:chemotaxis regulatin CheY-phosphate phosphatase CheZ
MHSTDLDGPDNLAEIREAVFEIRDRLRRQDRFDDEGHVKLLRNELIAMASSIDQARREIAALQPPERATNQITTAAGELEAILHTTQEAADQILTAAETVMSLSAQLKETGTAPELAARIEEQTMILLTACSFQDLTGQRTTKVLKALRFIEDRVTAMVDIWGEDAIQVKPAAAPEADKREDAHLLNGPAAGGVSQSAIDALFD